MTATAKPKALAKRTSRHAKHPARQRARAVRRTSSQKIYGWPIYDIAIGPSKTGEKGHAQGILAFGDRATGVVAVGGMAQGIVAVGGLSWGLLTVGGVTFGLLGCIGGVALGGFALGGAALGTVTRGGLSIGLKAFGGKHPYSLLDD